MNLSEEMITTNTSMRLKYSDCVFIKMGDGGIPRASGLSSLISQGEISLI